MIFTLKLTKTEKEAAYSAYCAMAEHSFDSTVHTDKLYRDLTGESDVIELTDIQLHSLLQGMSLAIENAENRADDELRAADYRRAKESIISKSRSQFSVIRGV